MTEEKTDLTTAAEPLTFDGVLLRIRPGCEDDYAFVVDSWLLSFRGQARARDAGRVYLRGHKRAIRECLRHSEVRVCCLDDKPDTILGWACISGNTIHYLFTKQDFRGRGIAKALLADYLGLQSISYTHKGWRPVTFTGWTYDPYQFPIAE